MKFVSNIIDFCPSANTIQGKSYLLTTSNELKTSLAANSMSATQFMYSTETLEYFFLSAVDYFIRVLFVIKRLSTLSSADKIVTQMERHKTIGEMYFGVAGSPLRGGHSPPLRGGHTDRSRIIQKSKSERISGYSSGIFARATAWRSTWIIIFLKNEICFERNLGFLSTKLM